MQILMPQLGETVTEGTVTAWHRREGEAVCADDILFEIETEKVATEVPAPAAGVLRRILVKAGETVNVGAPLAELELTGGEINVSSASPVKCEEPIASGAVQKSGQLRSRSPSKRDAHGRPLSPAVRRLVQQYSLDVVRLAGSGRGGRVRRKDVLAHLQGLAPSADVVSGGSRIVLFNRLRKRIAEHMAMSKSTSPHVLQAVEVDFQAVVAAREAVKDAWKQRHGHALTFLPFVAYAVCRAIGDFPLINASVEGESLRVHADVNLAIAVDLSFEGLVAPVIPHAQESSVAQLAQRIDELTRKARAGKLSPDELKGGTYTISNSGSYGTLVTAPIINQPQVAILSMDGIRKRPVVIESPAGDAVAIRPVGILGQSFDHRAMDGAYSAAFLQALKRTLETTGWSGLIDL